MTVLEITDAIATKLLSVVDAGLVRGVGEPIPGRMCVEAAVCFALNLPHGDDPKCVSPAIRSLKIRLNDSNWSSDQARAKGLRRLALAQLGSAGVVNNKEFIKRAAEIAIRKMVPIACRAAASIQKDDKHREALLVAAARCEKDGSTDAANTANTAATYAANATHAAANTAANAYAADAADAAAYAADAATYAADAAHAAANTAANAYAADAANTANTAVTYAAYAAAYAANDGDSIRGDFAEAVVQVLIDMKSPGCKWLWMTEEKVA